MAEVQETVSIYNQEHLVRTGLLKYYDPLLYSDVFSTSLSALNVRDDTLPSTDPFTGTLPNGINANSLDLTIKYDWADWYVSPSGSPTATGTYDDPLDFATIIGGSSPVLPGQTVYLRGGTYTPLTAGLNSGSASAGHGVYIVYLSGSSNNYITLRSYPGEWARINGGVEIWGINSDGYLTWRCLEIAPTPTTRSFANITAAVAHIPNGFGGDASHINVYRCYIHDCSNVFPMPLAEGDWKVKENVIQNVGWYTSDTNTNRDYDIYTHNTGGGNMYIERNVLANSFGTWGLAMKSGGGEIVQDYYARYNIFFDAGIYAGNDAGAVQNIHINDNYKYSLQQGTIASGGKTVGLIPLDHPEIYDVEVKRNYIVSQNVNSLMMSYQRQVDIQNNTIVRIAGDTYSVYQKQPATSAEISMIVDNNIYHNAGNAARFGAIVGGAPYYTFAAWKTATGYDANSTHTTSLPTTNVIGVIPSEIENGYGFVAIYNWEGSTSVDVDLSTLNIINGALCRYRNALNFDEYVDFVYDASNPTLTIAMNDVDWTLKLPTAYDSPLTWSVNPMPTFGAFQIESLETESRYITSADQEKVLRIYQEDHIVRTGLLKYYDPLLYSDLYTTSMSALNVRSDTLPSTDTSGSASWTSVNAASFTLEMDI